MSAPSSYSLKAWLALLAVCVIWGTTYLANKVGVTHVPPLLFSAIRQLLAGFLILGWFVLRSRMPWWDWTYLRFQMGIGLLMLSIGNGLSLVALRYLPSGIAALLSAALPFVMVMLNVIMQTDERPRLLSILGISVGMLGIAYMSWDELTLSADVGYVWGLVFLFLAQVG